MVQFELFYFCFHKAKYYYYVTANYFYVFTSMSGLEHGINFRGCENLHLINLGSRVGTFGIWVPAMLGRGGKLFVKVTIESLVKVTNWLSV